MCTEEEKKKRTRIESSSNCDISQSNRPRKEGGNKKGFKGRVLLRKQEGENTEKQSLITVARIIEPTGKVRLMGDKGQ